MPRVPITNLDDPRIAVYRALKATNQTRGLDQFVVEGEKLVERLAASRFPLVSVLATDRYLVRNSVALAADVPVYVVPHEQVHELVGFPFHRGVLGCGQRVAWPALEEMLLPDHGSCTLVLCPRLSNPENLGSIARLGDVFGIDAIVAGPSCPDPLSRRVLRVSMGSALRVPVLVAGQPLETADWLVSRGVESGPPWPTRPRRPSSGYRGPPGWGWFWATRTRASMPGGSSCGRSITIPMRPGAGSLNVAVAAGILLYHLTKPAREVGSG